ncbi:hypothetical protein [Stutzerimonas stutzeri]|jgi:hypothetical protein|uniref:hypothetical protein n=1 Tax=Stutzerimonas stutzeri TaxID=316 RepID=UPI0014759463|nr:hypothetical protein [Stutzerimonas stutzeri]MDH1669338.1 phosphoribosyltransferase family protein [Stutzerimonas stutzeri]MDI9738490.1 hypothetical protein [Stutzerimonas stutzeri]NMY64642.1 hypothetical protein [Pseudomonas sp. WS 5018]
MISPGYSALWSEVLNSPVDVQLAMFRQASAQPCADDVKTGFRAFAADLFARELVSMAEYVSIFGGTALNYLTPAEPGLFRDMVRGTDATALAGIYSRAKYGSVGDIQYLARQLIDYLCGELDRSDSQWSRLFRKAKACGDNVVMMTTGWRNVPSTANVLYEIVVEEVNVKLAHMALPTIINVKLPRIAPPCEEYASLSTDEREHVNLIQDHVIPAENFYRWSGVHVIFGDDVLVTGSTADKVLYESMRSGAKSFHAIYPVAIDPRVALGDASVEDRLNSVAVEQRLDDTVAELLSARDYQPILRTLRLLFGEGNRESLAAFLPKVPAPTWLRLYKSALGNEFLSQPQCAPSLVLLREYLTNAGLLSTNGRAIHP